MTTPTSRAAYGPYYEVLDRALDSTLGIRIECETQGDAFQYRVRLHTARAIDRELNKVSREPDDPRYSISDYDRLIIRVRPSDERNLGGKWWVYVEPNTLPNRIEELTA